MPSWSADVIPESGSELRPAVRRQAAGTPKRATQAAMKASAQVADGDEGARIRLGDVAEDPGAAEGGEA